MSRRRKSKRNNKSRRDSPQLFQLPPPDDCDCPACSGVVPDVQPLIDDLVSTVAELSPSTDPLELEMLAAAVLAIGGPLGEAFENALLQGFIPGFEARADAGALAMLLAIAAVAQQRVAAAASEASARLVEAGLERPGWAAELVTPVTVGDCSRLADVDGTATFLGCSFQRSGRAHGLLIHVDELDCGAASDIVVLDGDELSDALESMRADAVEQGVDIVSETLDPEEFRWQVERALDARAVHDAELTDEDIADLATEDGGPGYGAMAVLVRARMTALPKPQKAPAPHGDGEDRVFEIPPGRSLVQPKRSGGNRSGGRTSAARTGRAARPALPPKRTRSDGAAPVYQLKVGLRGATPPIWRRLEVPADISLARLHTIIQIAFGWDDSHLHAFETSYGSFGGSEPGDRAETSVTLEQVAPAVDTRLSYTYDFGDDWVHDLLVEKVLDRTTISYPRCTGGRRAAPPEDCGGVWGYQELLQVLDDPSDQDHLEKLEWLGLDDGAQFDPARFSAAEVTRALSFGH